MEIVYNDRVSSILSRQKTMSKPSIERWLHRNGIECSCFRLISDKQEYKADRYANVLGKKNTLVNQSVKVINRTDKFSLRLGILNENPYPSFSSGQEDLEIIYAENILKTGDNIIISLYGFTVTYKVLSPQTYYDVYYTATLKPISKQDKRGEPNE